MKALPVPPPELRCWVGPFRNASVYRGSGRQQVRDLCRLVGLRPRHTFLDVGCGCGRVACGLTEYLDTGGVYRGFDVARELVDWCEGHITPRHPNFHFEHANIRARSHNPHGRVDPTAYRFPYADGVFDVALASSVFTHMRPESVEHYMAEIARVLKRGGRLICSHFLINAASLQAIEKKTTVFNFCHKMATCRTFDPQQPEEGLAYEEPYALDLFAANGFHIRWPVHYGNWRRRRSREVTQDWIVGVRK